MLQPGEGHEKHIRCLERWEMNAFLAMSSLAGAFVAVIVSFMLPLILGPRLDLPKAVWAGIGFLAIMLCLYPALRVQGRLEDPPRILSWTRYFLGALIGALVGALVFVGLQAWI
jgi:hypothetical protein